MDIYDKIAIENVRYVQELTEVQNKINFFEERIELEDKQQVERRLQDLLAEKISSVQDLEGWLQRQSRLFEEIEEVLSGVYIAFNRYNDDPQIKKRYTYQQEEILPLLKKYTHLLQRKFAESPYRPELNQEKYGLLIRSIENSLQLYNEENISLEIKEDQLVNEYTETMGALTVLWQGEEKTLAQMQPFLQNANRQTREQAWKMINEQLRSIDSRLNEIMSQLISLRQQIAHNAGFANYRDYMFRKYERFDYTAEDCHLFYEAVKEHVVPLLAKIQAEHQRELGLDEYRMWDTQAVPQGQEPLQPFQAVEQLITGTTTIFAEIDPQFAAMIKQMHRAELLDLESRRAKSPGGFCATLPITGHSFIFMNAAGTHDDLTTFIHEGGHSVHHLLMNNLDLAAYKETPMESAELASMSMELLTMDKWGLFYPQEEDLKRAQREQIEGIISFLPWAMVIDQFQHWLYTNPQHSIEERKEKFNQLTKELSHHYIQTAGYEEELALRWLMQLHLFEVPFYYIEYAIAQLGALQLWKAYHDDPQQTVARYKQALSLGSSKSLPEVYQAAGIRFDFSAELIKEYMHFAEEQWQLRR